MRGRLHGEMGLLSLHGPHLHLPALLWQAINASNEPAAHCRLGQMLWERTAFPSTPHRSALEEASSHTNTSLNYYE
jgi:hypothetical protein